MKDRVALVTGGGSGLGQAVCLKLAAAGARVVVVDVQRERSQAVVARIEEGGGTGSAAIADVGNSAEVQAVVATALRDYGQIDALVNCAGIVTFSNSLETSEEEWDRVMGVNLKGPFLFSKAVAAHMVGRQRGRIVNIGSSASAIGNIMNSPFGSTSYCVSKAGVHCLTRMMAGDLAPHGITVNTVAPGTAETPMHAGRIEEFREQFTHLFPLGRFALPGDIADAVQFLLSDEAKYITGQAIHVNGGLVMTN